MSSVIRGVELRVHDFPAQRVDLAVVFLQAIANELTDAHNDALAELLPEFLADHQEASVILFNFEAFLLNLAQNASQYGITDLTTPCYVGAVAGSSGATPNTSAVCPDPNTHAYWDGVHPTGRVHDLWGQAVAGQLMPYFSSSASSGRKLMANDKAGFDMGSHWLYGQPL